MKALEKRVNWDLQSEQQVDQMEGFPQESKTEDNGQEQASVKTGRRVSCGT